MKTTEKSMHTMTAFVPKNMIDHSKPLLESLKEPFEKLRQTTELEIAVNGFKIVPQRPSDLRVVFRVFGTDSDVRNYVRILLDANF